MLTSIYLNYSVGHNLICKVNKNLALRLRLDSTALRVLLLATVLEVLVDFISAILQTALKYVKDYPL